MDRNYIEPHAFADLVARLEKAVQKLESLGQGLRASASTELTDPLGEGGTGDPRGRTGEL